MNKIKRYLQGWEYFKTDANDSIQYSNNHKLHTTKKPESKKTSLSTSNCSVPSGLCHKTTKFPKQMSNQMEGQKRPNDPTELFSFEKKSLAIMGNSVMKFKEDGPDDYVDSSDPRVKKAYRKVNDDVERAEKSMEKHIMCFKVFTGIVSMYSIIDLMASFFGLLFIAIHNIDLSRFIGMIIGEIVACLILLYVSSKGGHYSDQTYKEKLSSFKKYFLILSLIWLGVALGLCVGCNIEEVIENAKEAGDRQKFSQNYPNVMFGIVTLVGISSFVLKFIICVFYFLESFCILKKIDIYEIALLAKQKLPLGYKVYIASPDSKNLKNHNSPNTSRKARYEQ